MGVSAVDLDSLLQPIEGESPTGSDLRRVEDSPLARFRDIRSSIMARRKQAEAERLSGEAAVAEAVELWDELIDTGCEILRSHSKDLEVAADMLEALTRTDGFEGAALGFRLLTGLVQGFWDGSFPAIDEMYGDEDRVGRVESVAASDRASLLMAVRATPITAPSQGDRISLLDLQQGQEFERYVQQMQESDRLSIDQRDERIEERRTRLQGKTAELCLSALGQIPADHLRGLLARIDDLMGAIDEFSSALSERRESGAEPKLSFIILKDAIDEVRAEIAERVPPEPEGGEEEAGGAGGEGGSTSGGGKMNREAAIALVERAASYFEASEPHSPVQFALRRAVRWARTPYDQLLEEIVRDSSSREDLFRLVGMQSRQEEDSY
ncbi:MAG: type VI secretion system protein TssA [Planctomycetota bacterium]